MFINLTVVAAGCDIWGMWVLGGSVRGTRVKDFLLRMWILCYCVISHSDCVCVGVWQCA